MLKKITIVAVAALTLAGCQNNGGEGGNRDQIRIVGSSTVYPFAKAVSEQFALLSDGNPSPILESTGTGGGMELFCGGVGTGHPDMANASRRMKRSELERCMENGVDEVVEFTVGLDGIAIAQAQDGAQLTLSTEDIYKAVAANPYGKPNNYTNWSDIDPSYPDVKINIYGPPKTSGTRDAFEELIMLTGCEMNQDMDAMMATDEEKAEAICTEIRTDGAYVESGENDNLIIQKLSTNPDTVGIFGYSFLEENTDRVRGIPINGSEPTFDNISAGRYPGARSLYVYIKKAHVGVIPGLKEYISEFIRAAAPGEYLSKIGLIPASDRLRKEDKEAVETMPALTLDQLQ